MLALAWLAALRSDPGFTRRAELAVRHTEVAADLGDEWLGAFARGEVEAFWRPSYSPFKRPSRRSNCRLLGHETEHAVARACRVENVMGRVVVEHVRSSHAGRRHVGPSRWRARGEAGEWEQPVVGLIALVPKEFA